MESRLRERYTISVVITGFVCLWVVLTRFVATLRPPPNWRPGSIEHIAHHGRERYTPRHGRTSREGIHSGNVVVTVQAFQSMDRSPASPAEFQDRHKSGLR